MTAASVLRIGGASGFWGDSAIALPQLLRDPALDYIIFDYLAEITMSILARARATDPALGYATDFVSLVERHLPAIAERRVRLISNAGGLNPAGCAAALRAHISAAGLSLKVAVVEGDDLVADQARWLAAIEPAGRPTRLLSLNAYLGAFPIAAALSAGADIVITGRCVDSALALAPCVHAFGWDGNDFDLLSAGSLAGHLIECGAQGSGGLFTDWRLTGDWADIGYPIVEIAPDGRCIVTKVEGTGGLVSVGSVAEQLVYEIGDPTAYRLPDVTCDWTEVELVQVGPDRVAVSGARGAAPPAAYKASATYADGYRVGMIATIVGEEAPLKGEKLADAVLRRVGRMLADAGRPPFTETSVELLGAEAEYGPHGRAADTREVQLKIAARHAEPAALEILVREYTSAGTSMAPGLCAMGGNRPKVSPVVRLMSLYPDRASVDAGIRLSIDGSPVALPRSPQTADGVPAVRTTEPAPAVPQRGPMQSVKLIRLAWGRSGDKGNDVNIGIIARQRAYLPAIRTALTAEFVAAYFGHFGPAAVARFDLPGIGAVNFLLKDVLGGGGIASLRNDPQGKAYAQMLLGAFIAVPADLAIG